jgi:hypothetical protein
MTNTEFDHEDLKWGKLVGPKVCAEAGIDPHSFAPMNAAHPEWAKVAAAAKRLKHEMSV